MTARKKLIEVALPLEAINAASAREKSIRHGHPSTLHLWWARRPLAACRAVLFASLVDDPSAHPDQFPTDDAQEAERKRLFDIIERLVTWENSTNEAVLEEARAEILRSTDGNPPPVLDPFCGGGSIPLEAQRLGLSAYASDLNPVAVLITKALVEIPPKFADRPPVHPDARRGVGATGSWRAAAGLAEDVRRYGAWMRDEAERRIGHLYPKVRLPAEQGGGEATVIAWLWARTVTCPNPACRAPMPLVRSFALSTKTGTQVWVEPIVDRAAKTVRFEVRTGAGAVDGTVGRQGARCVVCGAPVALSHVRSEGRAGRMGERLMAIVAEGPRGRLYLEPDVEHESVARSAEPPWRPNAELPHNPRDFKTPNYGMRTFADLFTPRQLVALTTFSDLVTEARELALQDAVAGGLTDDGVRLADGGQGAAAYADAIATYLGFVVDKGADYWSSICSWHSGRELVRNTFARQAIPMVWDYAEANPFGAAGSFEGAVDWVARSVATSPRGPTGRVKQLDAVQAVDGAIRPLVATDPPYYDNIGYADLSDFFYVWLRRCLKEVYPDLFSTLLTPKEPELVATPYRFGGDRTAAEHHFEEGLRQAFQRMRELADPDYPLTLFYAFKQAETTEEGEHATQVLASTGWATMLEGLLSTGFAIDGTWPMRSELGNRMLASGTNALASSIVLVCRPRAVDAGITSRRGFIDALKGELPSALRTLQQQSIAPVDLAQASIGPGMAVFSRYARVLEPDGSTMRVRSALGIINEVLDEIVAQQEGEFDGDTRWAVTWFEVHAFGDGRYGDAEVLARARDVSVDGLCRAGIVRSGGGKVRLLRLDELRPEWDPATDVRPTVWEATHHLLRALDTEGEVGAARLVARIGSYAEMAKDLAYRLYLICERKGWAEEAIGYNRLAASWPEISRLAADERARPAQAAMNL